MANDDVGSPSGTITSVSVDGTAHPLPLPQGGIPFAGGLLQVWPDGNFSVSTQQAGQFSFRYTLTNAGSSDDASVTVTMGSSSPAAMVALSDQDQTATAGTAVAEPPSVRVTDEWGNPVAGVGVTFTAFPVGSVTGSPATTDANGVATVGNWTLGTTTGLFRERLQTVTATAGQLSTTFTGRAVAGPPVSVTVRPRGGSTPFEAPPKESLNVGEEQTFEAIVYDAYGNTVYGQTVNFSSSNPEAVDLSAPRLQIGLGGTGPATYVDVRALLVAVDQTVEIRASVAGMPNVQGVSSIVVNKTLLPVAKSDDIQLAPCPAFGCLSVPVTFTTNVFLDHGFGPDDRGSPVAVITRFDVTPPEDLLLLPQARPLRLGRPSAAFLASVQLSADGTLTITRRDQSLLDGGFTAVLFYELKNIGGSSIGAVTISRGSNGSDCTVSSLGCAVGGMSTSASASTSIPRRRASSDPSRQRLPSQHEPRRSTERRAMHALRPRSRAVRESSSAARYVDARSLPVRARPVSQSGRYTAIGSHRARSGG